MNLPGVVVDLPTLTAKDEVDLVEWGLPNDIDFIAASFVRKGSDLDYIRKVSSAKPFPFLYFQPLRNVPVLGKHCELIAVGDASSEHMDSHV